MKANPDKAQGPARRLALVEGKLLFMAVPRLAEQEPFYRLDPAELGADLERAADRYVAAELTSTVGLAEMPQIDFVVCGSVAVNHEGVRIGKGARLLRHRVGAAGRRGAAAPRCDHRHDGA